MFLWRGRFSFFLFCLLQLSLETFLGFRKKEKKLWPWLQQKKKNEEGNMLNLLFPLLPKNIIISFFKKNCSSTAFFVVLSDKIFK
jgi:hypothetical protein